MTNKDPAGSRQKQCLNIHESNLEHEGQLGRGEIARLVNRHKERGRCAQRSTVTQTENIQKATHQNKPGNSKQRQRLNIITKTGHLYVAAVTPHIVKPVFLESLI